LFKQWSTHCAKRGLMTFTRTRFFSQRPHNRSCRLWIFSAVREVFVAPIGSFRWNCRPCFYQVVGRTRRTRTLWFGISPQECLSFIPLEAAFVGTAGSVFIRLWASPQNKNSVIWVLTIPQECPSFDLILKSEPTNTPT